MTTTANSWEVREVSELREKLYHCNLYPDMDLFVLPKPAFQKKYAIFSTRFGSIDNTFQVEGTDEVVAVPDGVAHFLEHKLFEGEQGNAFDRFASLGASANAFTTFTHTTYLFSTAENFEQSLELLLDFVQEPYFTEETVRNEQGIIGQEIRMYEDHPQWRVFFNLLGALYREHPVRNDIAGTVKSISRITPELLFQCYRKFYHPSNMAVFAVGDLSPERVGRQVEENLTRRGYQPLGGIKRLYPREPAEINEQRVTLELMVSEPIFNLGFKDTAAKDLKGEELLRREIAMELLLEIIFGQSETLFNNLYQDGLIDDRFDAGYTAEQSYAYTLIGGETRDPDQLYARIMDSIARVSNGGISGEQFERHRRKLLGQYMRRFNSLEFIANNFLAYRFRGADLFKYPAHLRQIGKDEVAALVEQNLAPERHAVSIILPSRGSD